MEHQYKAIQWNKNKVVYDIYVVIAISVFMGIFIFIGLQPTPNGHVADPVVLLIRALGTTAFALLTITLTIGPLARLSPRFRPMLYNRRHLGVITFLVASGHFGLALAWYHAGGALNPLVSLFVSNPLYDSIPGFPFEVLGLAAFLVLFIMAATSHDFWLNNLSAPLWKILHMMVYPAYVLLVFHVILGALMTEKSLVYPIITAASFIGVSALHGFTGLKEWKADNGMKWLKTKGWVDVCAPMDIENMRAVIAPLASGDRVAIFRYDNKISAVTNACRHQNGPLGEGRVIDGCITCPWHGWQYRPDDGVSPPPFTEKIATYNVRIENDRVLLDPNANAPGTRTEPALIPDTADISS